MRNVLLLAVIFAFLIPGCGGGGGSSLSSSYTVSRLAVPAGTSGSQAVWTTDDGIVIGWVADEDGVHFCTLEANDQNLHIITVPQEISSYISFRLIGGAGIIPGLYPNSPLRTNNRGYIPYAAENSVGVCSLINGTTLFSVPSSPDTPSIIVDINDSNTSVGWHIDGETTLPMMWEADGTSRQLSLPANCTTGLANAINNLGQAAGQAYYDLDHPSSKRIVVWNSSGSVAREIALTTETEGEDVFLISDNGYIVIGNRTCAHLISPSGSITALIDPRGPDYISVRAINANGQIAGNSNEGPVIFKPNGSIVQLPSHSTGEECYVTDIDDNGVAVGFTGLKMGQVRQSHAVKWTPVR